MKIFRHLVILFGLGILATGCATPQKFSAKTYRSESFNLAPVRVVTGKKIYVCPVMERLSEANRKFMNPQFSGSGYLTDAFNQELAGVGLSPVAAPFPTGPGFDAARQAITTQASQQENAVYLVSELRWISHVRVTLDAKLYNPAGTVLYEKRGTCIRLGVPTTCQQVTKMALWQIIADPDFQKALQ